MPDDVPKDADDRPDLKGQKHFRPAWLSDVVAAWIFTALTIASWTAGGALLNSHRQPFFTAWSIFVFGFFCFGGAGYFWLLNHRKRQTKNKMPSWLPGVTWIVFFSVGFGCFLLALHQERIKDPVHPGEGLDGLITGPDSELVREVRAFIEKVNPDFLKAVDAGRPEIRVFIGTTSQVKLALLAQKPGFEKLLSYHSTDNILQGSSNSMNHWLNEQGEEGAMTGFIFSPKDALRKYPPPQKNLPRFSRKIDGVLIHYGSNSTELSLAELGDLPHPVFGGSPVQFSIQMVKKQPTINLVVLYGGKDVLSITNNQITSMPLGCDYNCDEKALEVISPRGDPIFQLVFKSDTEIYLRGIFPSGNQVEVVNDSSINFLPIPTNGQLNLKGLLTPIFQYPSDINIGIRKQ